RRPVNLSPMVPVVRKTFVHLRLREARQAGRGNALDALQEADYTCSQTMAHARPALLASSSTKSDTVLRERLAAICSLRYTGSLNRSLACTLRVPAGRPRVAPSTFITARYALSNRARLPCASPSCAWNPRHPSVVRYSLSSGASAKKRRNAAVAARVFCRSSSSATTSTTSTLLI